MALHLKNGVDRIQKAYGPIHCTHIGCYFIQTKCSWRRMDVMKRTLFHEYYEKGVNISLVEELIRIGKECNLSVRREDDEDWHGGIVDRELVELMMSPVEGHKEVRDQDSEAKSRG